MSSIRRLGAYAALFLILLVFAAGLLSPVWRPLDYRVFNALSMAEPVGLEDDTLIIDLPYTPAESSSFNLPDFRARTTDLLITIDQQSTTLNHPRAVILDMFYGSDSRGLAPLVESVETLQAKGVKVYAVFDTMDLAGVTFEQRLAAHAGQLYDILDGDGLLHTQFDQRQGAITYRSHLQIPRAVEGFSETVKALPLQVAIDLNPAMEEPEPPRNYVVPLGDQGDVQAQTYRYLHTGGSSSGGQFSYSGSSLASPPDFGDKILIVASYEGDRVVQGRPGPEHVAWALDDQRNFNRSARIPLNNPAITLALAIFLALFMALVYAVLFKYVKRLQTHPIIISLLSATIAAGVLVGVTAVTIALGYVVPVGLALVAIFIASALAWHFARSFLVTGIAEGSGKYDVFISYSRKDGDWVYEQLYQPLSELRKADGSALTIFFDRNEIKLGEAFTSRYMWAIVDSRCFVPVFSSNYYGRRSHGRNEMDLAYKRKVEEIIQIFPIALDENGVPEIYSGLNYLSVQQNPGFIDQLRDALLGEESEKDSAGSGR